MPLSLQSLREIKAVADSRIHLCGSTFACRNTLPASPLVMIVSCTFPVGDQADLTGLTITIGNEINAKTLEPGTVMVPSLYMGIDPVGSTGITGATLTQTDYLGGSICQNSCVNNHARR
jgi:hypothetical protein